MVRGSMGGHWEVVAPVSEAGAGPTLATGAS